MKNTLLRLVSALLLAWQATGGSLQAEAPDAKGVAFFETKIRPLLIDHCYECHGADAAEGELQLDSFAGLARGGASGMAIVPGKPEESLLLAAVGYQNEELQMPPDGRLSPQQVADLRHWIELGAPHPESDGTPLPTRDVIDLDAARSFWAFQTPGRPPLPPVRQTAWPSSPIDYFVLHGLEAHDLAPAPQADKRTLLRRVTFDLTGLPPTPEELDAFLADQSPLAWRRVVDRLLNSPRYGERWGRHWLDVARYADSNGLDENVAHGTAWRYRDYVIAAWNADKPYDQFLREQVAGDLLPTDDPLQRRQHLIATAFLSLGPKVLAEGDEQKMEMDIVDEQLSTLGQTVLGLTIGCARCHDHKFDPISQADYYALAGIFKSTQTMESLKRIARWNENEIATPEQQAAKEAHDAKLAALQAEIDAQTEAAKQEVASRLAEGEPLPEKVETHFSETAKAKLKELNDKLAAAKEGAPVLPTAMGVEEGQPNDMQIHLRGSHLTPGRQVPRGVPQVLVLDQPLEVPSDQSGRLQLAHWLARPDHPLTARVMVNRVWRWYFGRGLVPTVDNFGTLGERPTHPQLLDWLAAELVADSWSLKDLHRAILLSSTYRMSSRYDARSAQIDPENTWHWRAPLRRLEAEALRDALLAVSGQLDLEMGGSMLHVANREFIFNHTSKDETSYDQQRRSVYLPVIRNHLYDVFSLFDYTDASVPNGDRPTSTIAPQALFLLNSEAVTAAATRLSERLLREADEDQRAEMLYELALGRPPTAEERERTDRYLESFRQHFEQADAELAAWAAVSQAVLASSEFLYLR